VTTDYSVDLRLVADIVEAPLQEIVALNPSLLRMATPPDDSFTLHLPPGTKDLFLKRIEEVPVDRRRAWRFHKVVDGETLDQVARAYHVSPTELAFVNKLDAGADLSGVETLVVPAAPVASSLSTRSTRYTTRKGDTLVTVADRFNVSVDDLRGWNHLKGAALAPGRTLYVSEPARVASPRGRRHGARAASAGQGKASSKDAGKAAGAKSAHRARSKAASSSSKASHPASAKKESKHHSSAPR